jgi:hypothetical protein
LFELYLLRAGEPITYAENNLSEGFTSPLSKRLFITFGKNDRRSGNGKDLNGFGLSTGKVAGKITEDKVIENCLNSGEAAPHSDLSRYGHRRQLTMPIVEWRAALNHLAILFELLDGRYKDHQS